MEEHILTPTQRKQLREQIAKLEARDKARVEAGTHEWYQIREGLNPAWALGKK